VQIHVAEVAVQYLREASRWVYLGCCNAKQSGLACAIWADDDPTLVSLYRPIDVAEDFLTLADD
jgi:hypothetical protein